ncbi:MAG: hypothetical protein SGJ10_04370 [Bacteroidota bacterium]|nr:hypothetical protein [Bacteroidota bacterium]
MLKEGINILYKDDLTQFIHSELFGKFRDVPISKIRAISQLNNPSRLDDKPMLLVQIKAGEIVAYLGVYHDCIIKDQTKITIGWTNDLWVAPKDRGRGYAGNLIVELYKHFEGNLIVADYVPNTFHIYNSKGVFQKLNPIKGKRIFLEKPNIEWIDKRFGLSFKKILFNYYLKLKPEKHNQIDSAILLYKQNTIYKIGTEQENFIVSCKQQSIFNEDINKWNHWLAAPWLSETETENRFYFSTQCKPFKQFCLELRDESNVIKALVFILVRGDELKVKQIYATAESYDEVIKYIIHTAQFFESKQILLHDTKMFPSLKKYSSNYLFAVNSKKHLLAGNTIFNLMENVHVQVSDGDLAFT